MFGLDAPRWHAALNHFPVALLLAAVVFDLGAAIWKRESLKWAGIWTLWAGVLGGWAAVIAGKLAEKAIEHGEAIHELMEQHERQALVTMGIFTVILVWKLYRRFALPSVEQWVTRAFPGTSGSAHSLTFTRTGVLAESVASYHPVSRNASTGLARSTVGPCAASHALASSVTRAGGALITACSASGYGAKGGRVVAGVHAASRMTTRPASRI